MSTATNAVFLTGITIAGMGIIADSASAAVKSEIESFAFGSGNSVPFAQFDGSLGSLDSITIEMNSAITGDLNSEGFAQASVTVDGLLLAGINSDTFNTPFNFETSLTQPNAHIAAFIGSTTIPLLFSFNPGLGCNGCDWHGQVAVTYNYTPVIETPVPAALPLLASGVAGLGAVARRRRRGNTERK